MSSQFSYKAKKSIVPYPTIDDLKLMLIIELCEDETGERPASGGESGSVVRINMFHQKVSDLEKIVLCGSVPFNIHPAKGIDISNCRHGLSFFLLCTNRNPLINHVILYEAYITSKDLRKAVPQYREELVVNGVCQPFQKDTEQGQIEVSFSKVGTRVKISEATFTIPKEKLQFLIDYFKN